MEDIKNHSFVLQQVELKSLKAIAPFPMLLDVFDKEIRMNIAGTIGGRVNTRVSMDTRLKIIFFRVLDLLERLKNMAPKQKAKVYISLDKFPELEKKIIYDSNKRGMVALTERSYLITNFWKRNTTSLLRQIISNEFITFSKKLQSNGNAVLTDEQKCSEVEDLINKKITDCVGRLKRNNIQKVIVTGHSSVIHRILQISCEKLGIQFHVIFNGLILEENLITVAPIKADKFYVWSNKQKLYLDTILNELNLQECRKKLVFQGDPNFYNDYSKNYDGKVLIVISFIESLVSHNSFQHFKDTVHLLSKTNLVTIRPHPSDANTAKLETIARALDWDVSTLSTGTLEEDFSKCSIVIGGASAVLHSAYQSGLLTFQIKDLGGPEVANVRQVFLDDIENLLDQSELKPHNGDAKPQSEFNVDYFFKLET